MGELKTLIDKYKAFFGTLPEFGDHTAMTEAKKAETLECCIENSISAPELLNISKDHDYAEGRLILLPPPEIRLKVTYDEKGNPILTSGATTEQQKMFQNFKAEFDADKKIKNEGEKNKNHCSVWDYLMNEDLEKEGACKYGAREKR